MGYNNDWKTLRHGKTVETRIEPVKDENGLIIQWNKDYRTVEIKVEMETFTDVSTHTPTVGVPENNVPTVISDEYETTQKETNSGEHTKTTQTVSSWTSY